MLTLCIGPKWNPESVFSVGCMSLLLPFHSQVQIILLSTNLLVSFHTGCCCFRNQHSTSMGENANAVSFKKQNVVSEF